MKDFLDLDERLNALKVDKVVTTQNIDTTTPSGKMQRTILLAFAEFERDMIAERTREKLYRGIITCKSEDFQGLYDAIVDEPLINTVQDRLEKSRTDRYATYGKSDLLLLGLAHYGFCGSNMTTTFAKKEDSKIYLYYKCTNKSKFGAAKCECRDLSAEQLEGLVEKIILLIGQDNTFFDAVFKQIAENDNIGLRELKLKKDEITRNLGRIKKEIDNLTNAIAQSQNNLGLPALLASLGIATAQRFKAENELLQITRNVQNIEGQSIPKEALRKSYADLAEVYSGLDMERKRKLTGSIIREIGCLVEKKENKGQIRISFKGDGTVLQVWDIKENLETLVSRFLVEWLRE